MKAALFDMDGVLVDVSHSYIVAIQKTVEFYLGAPVNLTEIQEYRNRGGLNNDWDLTECVLRENGKDIEKQAIIDVFQKFYLGNNFDGLIESERWLLRLSVLEQISRICKTGIVTGRPRMETSYVLERFGVGDFFSVVITMDDVPPDKNKPDPFGIELALKNLSSDSVHYFGDTVDDMRAAKNAGVTPIGVLAPGSDQAGQKAVLLNHGASRILDDINDVLGVLS
jgi:HAD superfamily phosphatase